jgi:hypothetical protein
MGRGGKVSGREAAPPANLSRTEFLLFESSVVAGEFTIFSFMFETVSSQIFTHATYNSSSFSIFLSRLYLTIRHLSILILLWP